jgi:hypothetical protein
VFINKSKVFFLLILSNLLILFLGCNTVQSSPGSKEVEPGPAGPGLKNIEIGLD